VVGAFCTGCTDLPLAVCFKGLSEGDGWVRDGDGEGEGDKGVGDVDTGGSSFRVR